MSSEALAGNSAGTAPILLHYRQRIRMTLLEQADPARTWHKRGSHPGNSIRACSDRLVWRLWCALMVIIRATVNIVGSESRIFQYKWRRFHSDVIVAGVKQIPEAASSLWRQAEHLWLVFRRVLNRIIVYRSDGWTSSVSRLSL